MNDRRMTFDRRQAARRSTANSSAMAVSVTACEGSRTASLSVLRNGLPVEDALPGDNEMWEVGHVARFLKRSDSWVYKKSASGILPVHRLWLGSAVRAARDQELGWSAE